MMARHLRTLTSFHQSRCTKSGEPILPFSPNLAAVTHHNIWSSGDDLISHTHENFFCKHGSTFSGIQTLPFVSHLRDDFESSNGRAARLFSGSAEAGQVRRSERHDDVAGGSQEKTYLVRRAKPATGKTYYHFLATRLLKELEAAADKEERLRILKSRKGRELNIRSFWGNFIDVLRKSASPELAVEAFNWQRKELRRVDSANLYAKMISLAGIIRKPQLALSWFEDMANRKIKKSIASCNALIFALSKNDELEKALAVFQGMKNSKTCEPNVVTYNMLISMYGTLGELEKMEKILEDSKAAGLSPDRITYNTLLYAYLKNGKFDKMEDIYKMMLADSCEPGVVTFNALMLGHCRAVSVEKMEACLIDMQKHDIPVTGMVAEEVVRVYMKTGLVDRVEKVIEILEGSPDARYTTQLHSAILECFANAGKLDSIETHFERILSRKKKFASSSTLEGVISAFVAQNAFGRLHHLYRKLKDSECWDLFSSTFDLLIVEYSKSENFDKVEEVFGDMETAGHRPVANTLQAIYESRISAGDETGAQEIKQRMSQDDSIQKH